MKAALHPDSILDFQPRATQAIESVLFEIDTVWIAIPLSRVDRIVDITNIRNDFSDLGRVEPLDLHELLFGHHLAEPTAWTIYRDASNTTYGIPVDPVPTLIDIPCDRIRQLPPDFRTTSPLGIASHVALITEFDRELTVFMLVD
jgi:chemotaxis signal transduction protein